ncbi:hypothetical protein [Clostridioides sp. ES-S-0001-03]|uniref:hypothetical protein n=1 Tax=Clostridioides sp. ES-S-0001-03 TaxID=2770771 RepID=UPI001D0CB2E8|nr:hypothetical protein [Clostridioides sp. ES-S-0001-03]
MKIKKEYIEKVKNELKMLGDKQRKVKILKKEIAILKNKEVYKEINFEELGFKVKKSTKGIDDIVVTIESAIYNKETEIEIIEQKMKLFNVYLEELSEDEQKIIKELYFYNWSGKNSITKLSVDMNYCRTKIYNIHDSAVKKIALMKYKNDDVLV